MTSERLKSIIFSCLCKKTNFQVRWMPAGRQLTSESTNELIKGFDEIPGPKTWPIIGNLMELKQFGGQLEIMSLIEFLSNLHQQYGDIVKWKIFNRTQVFLFNPEHVKKVYQIEGTTPTRKPQRPWLLYYKKRGLPVGIFNSTNERWRLLRTAANPVVARPATIHSYIDKYAKVVNDFMANLDKQFDSNGSIVVNDFDKQLHYLTLELITLITLDRRILCVDEMTREQTAIKLIDEIDKFFKYTAKLNVSLPIWMYYSTKNRVEFFRTYDYLYSVISTHVNEATHRLMTSDMALQSYANKTILQQLILNKTKYKLNMDDINSIVIDLLIAGFDTTAKMLHYVVYELGRHPCVQEKLYAEIRTHINDGNHDEVNGEKLDRMQYLKLVLKEAMRTHTLLPVNGRILDDDLVLNGYRLPKGTSISMCTITMCQSEKYFKNAKKFEPERWSDNGNHINPYASLPFGFGTRNCLGRRASEQEMYILIIKLIQRYNIEYVGDEIGYKFGSLMQPTKSLNLRLTKRKL